jgi:hypothetical protein
MSRTFALAALILIPALVSAAPTPKKSKESIVVEVASVKTNTHTTYTRSTSWVMSKLPRDSYAYTDLFFAVVGDTKVVYSCAERDKGCPVLEAGSKIPAVRDGDTIFISTAGPSEKKPLVTRYKLVGNGW